MAAPPFANLYHLRTVADSSSKACYICYKPTTRVMITPDSKDFFYICPGHLADKGFASPVVDAEAEAAKAKKAAMDAEIEVIKKEYEEKQKRKKDKKKAEKDKDKDEAKDKDKKDDDDAEIERDRKIKAVNADSGDSKTDEGPRIFTLQKNIYQMRLVRVRNAEAAKKSQQRLKDPTFFPSAPKGEPL